MKTMNLWKISTLVLTGAFTAVVGFQLVPEAAAKGGSAACGDQPHMEAALRGLNEAESQLKAATPDKGGNRVVGMEETAAAIAAINRGCRFANH